MGQETTCFSCMKPVSWYSARPLLSWSNLCLPALDDITCPPPCPSPSLHKASVAKYINIHLRPLNRPLHFGTCSHPLVQVALPVPAAGFV